MLHNINIQYRHWWDSYDENLLVDSSYQLLKLSPSLAFVLLLVSADIVWLMTERGVKSTIGVREVEEISVHATELFSP